jgi:hypothetical protein
MDKHDRPRWQLDQGRSSIINAETKPGDKELALALYVGFYALLEKLDELIEVIKEK